MSSESKKGTVSKSDRSSLKQWGALQSFAGDLEGTHLRKLLADGARTESLISEYDGIVYDYSRQRVTTDVVDTLLDLADATKVTESIQAMANGDRINSTEKRPVLHLALRAARKDKYLVDGTNVVPEVWKVRDQMASFVDQVHREEWLGVTGKPLTDIIVIGIGGSYLGTNFVYEALKHDSDVQVQQQAERKEGKRPRNLYFLANVDPVAVRRVTDLCSPEHTLVVMITKSFSTQETLLNARTVRQWMWKNLAGPGKSTREKVTSSQIIAVSSNVPAAVEFGIDKRNIFPIWSWVGGRYSVTSAVGVLPLSLVFGNIVVDNFMRGCLAVDRLFLGKAKGSEGAGLSSSTGSHPLRHNLPVMLGLLSVWNTSFLGYYAHSIAAYSEPLCRFAAHIQQLNMESNGKTAGVSDGVPLSYGAGAIIFGEPGTNSQHSYFQLLHQGRVVPTDFIGFCRSQTPDVGVTGNALSSQDEFMANFFAQPDALAVGRTESEVLGEDGKSTFISRHKFMSGNRPSNVLLFREQSAYAIGQLLALYEHKTAVEGWVWGINSFDQFGVELGKKLAKKVSATLSQKPGSNIEGYNKSTKYLLGRYIKQSRL